ncbi:Lipin/Ned1/Smp2-domain-containing protein [Chlamydoabsidia padenii]|nr:Lipin/Ned1/Smp2-domain-containing protein [Chlamydoabsidia padenii]
MEYFGKLFSSVHTFYNELNPATLSGAIDIIVVEDADGNFSCSPFHVRFGKLSVLRPQEKKVVIKVNDDIVPYVMKVGDAGEAFFIFETDHDVPEEYQTSPLLDAYDKDGTKPTTEPPFLDIGQANTKPQDLLINTSVTSSDEFEDEQGNKDHKNSTRVSGELQSPKMVIEEQMEQVVTHLDHSYHGTNDMSLNHLHNKLANMDLNQQPTNATFPQNDGSTLLERALSEPVSSTTVTKETFTIRPIGGDLNSMWMEVTRNDDQHDHPTQHGDDDQHTRHQEQHTDIPAFSSNDTTDGDSIFLDIAGYKTQDQHDEPDPSTPTTPWADASDLILPLDENEGDNANQEQDLDQKLGTVNSWGWGESYKGEGESSTDSSNEVVVKYGQTYLIQVSLCGFSDFGADETQNAAVFTQHQISFGDFVQNPNIMNDKSLVFKHDDRYYAAGLSGPFFTSLLVFRKPMDGLPRYKDKDGSDTVQNKGTYRLGRGWRQWFSRSSVQAVESTTTTNEIDDNSANSKQEHPSPNSDTHHTTFTTTTKATTFGLDSKSVDHGSSVEGATGDPVTASEIFPKRRNFAKTLRLTSDQLKSLPLKKGVNTISYSVSSAYQGTATCVAKLFLWDANIKVVISDIDGTITKSDALGHVFTMIGKDWTHNGVAKLYTDVHHNGYQFLYLTSRAIGQADYTREYLKGVMQNDYQLPDGPVLMSPDRLFTSFHREVIIRKPEVFKMGCLRDVRRLFGDLNPFYAGFGNRITDGVSYRSVDVPTSRIFTIDPYGEVRLELLLGFKSSYMDLNGLVDQMFPPLHQDRDVEDQTYNDWNFWKTPLPILDLPEPEGYPNTTTTSPPSPVPTSPPLSSSSSFHNSRSSKPKPIVPDITTLPKESVIDLPSPSRRKRSILRRLTSRSSLQSNSSTSTTSSSLSSTSLLPPKKNMTTGVNNNITIGSSQSTPIPTSSTGKAPPPKDLSFELLDDDAFDATLDAIEDEIDMDSIPFI